MTSERAIEIIENEKCCVIRQSGPEIACDRNCARCELVLPDQEVLDAYDKAIDALERDRWIPVGEGQPEPTWGRVLAYTDEHQIMTLPAKKVGNGYVTHWRPLPEPPREGTS